MPSTTSILSTYTAIAASAMVVRTVFTEIQSLTTQFIPTILRGKILEKFGLLVGNVASQETTLIIEEYNVMGLNELYRACETYLSTRISPLVSELKISKEPRRKVISVTINKAQKLVEDFQGVKLTWEFVSYDIQKAHFDNNQLYNQTTESSERKSIRLTFHRRYKDMVLETYIPSVVNEFNLFKEGEKPIRLFSSDGFESDYNPGHWSSVILDHPSTFDTMAMDPDMKKDLVDDLDQFVNRREFYKRIGKAWKRGYVLYGPPGTGKSSLISCHG